VVVELAGGLALKEYALPILKSGRTLICLSTGAFADDDFKQEAIRIAAENNGRICIVNGAVGGLDFLQTCSLQHGEHEVIIETTKSPKSLLGAPGLEGINLDLAKRAVVFEGGVQEAIKGFPKNINVGVITALASENPQTKVRIVADPSARSNTHKITYRSALADATMEFSGKPDPANPKSSTTAALSAAACLKNLYSPITFW
ncbi:aspartate dehydrogenase domain-containing protein, partial [Parasutterella excrementihominis]|uniref:aspartate dehydrogenase domain-containing protein n=1 Tax=Parasutterella excrementihominis TaxID=487175 RepID=UPI003AF02E5E